MSNDAYRLFREICARRCVYNITLIENIPSIMKHGILCYNKAASIPHHSIALTDVQDRRESILIPNGLHLHDYANVYFNPRNPMMYRRKDEAHRICVLAVNAKILDFPNCIVTDGNAASRISRFYSPVEGLRQLDFNRIHATYWNDPDPLVAQNNKRIECAEVLIPHSISYEMIVGAVVVDQEAQSLLQQIGFDKEIKIYPNFFFR